MTYQKSSAFLLIILFATLLLGLLFGVMTSIVPTAVAAPLADSCFIETTGDNTTDYASADASALQTAVDAASPNDTLKIAGTCAGVQQTNGITQTVYINKNLVLQGGYTSTNWLASPDPNIFPTTLDAQDSGRVVYISSGNSVTLDSLIIQNGNTTTDGGGVYLSSASLTILGGQIISNTASGGGGIFHRNSGTTVLSGTLVSYNRAKNGGGLMNNGTNHYALTNTTLSHNQAFNGDGGGIFLINSGQADLVDSTVFSNTASSDGGGLFNDLFSTMLLTDTIVSHNQADTSGGGIRNDKLLTIHGGQITSNTVSGSSGDGGGLYLGNANAVVTQTGVLTLAYNQVGDKGGGLYVANGRISLNGARILSNRAGNTGGAVYQSSNADAIAITNSCLVFNSDTAVFHFSGPTLVTTGNWWGATDGPSGAASGHGDSINNATNVDASGFLSSAPADCPAYTPILSITSGDGQSPEVENIFSAPLAVTLAMSENGVPFSGEVITFTGPSSGASINPSVLTATTNSSGIASVTPTANNITGTYQITVTAAGSNNSVQFSLTNTVYAPLCFVSLNNSGITNFSSANAGAVQVAINAASAGDTLKIAGTCAGAQPVSGQVQTAYIAKNLTLQGGYTSTNWLATPDPDTYPTVLDADNNGRVVYIPSGYTVTLDSLIMQNGRTTSDGGGIHTAGVLTISNSQVISNTADSGSNGGGILNESQLTVVNSLISGNLGNAGGGVMDYVGQTTLISSTVQNNTATNNGGGLFYTGNSTVMLIDSLLAHNEANNDGGGLYAQSGNGSTVISNTHIYSNTSSSYGGGLSVAHPITMVNSLVHQNYSDNYGSGGYFSDNDSILIQSSDFISNTSSNEGAGLFFYNSQATIQASRILSNTVLGSYGGGIYDEGSSTIAISDSEIGYNRSTDGGGGIYLSYQGYLSLANSTIHHNSATGAGGGLYMYQSTAYLSNSTFSHNQATQEGGGIYSQASNSQSGLFTLTHVTLVSNTASISGGGLYLDDTTDGNAYIAQATLQNSLIAHNSGGDCAIANSWEVLDASLGYNLDSDGSCVAGGGAGNLTSASPGVGPLADNGGETQTHALQPGSPAIDAGDPTYAVVAGDYDQRGIGYARVQNGRLDIGAYEFSTYTLTVNLSGTRSGVVSSVPAGIDCGLDCNNLYAGGTVVTLTAMANTDSTFTNWEGACSGTGDCVVTMSQARNVTATFTLKQYALTVTVDGNGTVTSDPAGIDCGVACEQSFDYGTVITLTAVADTGSTFSGWAGACTNTSGDCVVTMNQAKNVTATFTLNQYALTVTVDGNGTVTSDPAGIDCGVACEQSFDYGTVITLTAVADTNSTFSGWAGACTNTSGDCVVTLDQAQNATATFAVSYQIYLPIITKP